MGLSGTHGAPGYSGQRVRAGVRRFQKIVILTVILVILIIKIRVIIIIVISVISLVISVIM